ncbi:MAG: DoxX family protein [candidate division Zixibacteria bacterium]|nr:DoxX family protein [candidate division Zixibacteria bacterium]
MHKILTFLTQNTNKPDLGLLIVRVGMGLSMALFHGWGKISAPDRWVQIGGNMQRFGIDFAPAWWGFMAGFSEFVCSLLIAVGLFFRPATCLLGFTMFVAAVRHLSLPADDPGGGFSGASHALEFLVVCIGLLLSGPGKYSLMPGKKV